MDERILEGYPVYVTGEGMSYTVKAKVGKNTLEAQTTFYREDEREHALNSLLTDMAHRLRAVEVEPVTEEKTVTK